MPRRLLKTILPLIVLGAILAGLLFAGYATTANAPGWVRTVSVEIQAACRDAGTQWMVVICLVSYLIVFIVLEAKSIRLRETTARQEVSGLRSKVATQSEVSGLKAEVESRHPSPVTRHILFNSNFWLMAFIALVLLRYAFDYTNATKSLQVVVLLTGLVVGKGVALWAAWSPSLKSNVQSLKSELPLSRPAATLSPSDGERAGVRGDHPLNSQLSTINKPRAILSLLVFLLAAASLWHPERGMEFFYRGQQRWTGPWDNPNLYGVLMGVGTVLAVGILVSRLKTKGSSRGAKVESREPEPVGRVTPCAPEDCPPINYQLIHSAQCLLFLCAAALCSYGLLKSYSRGAWLGTACGLGFLVWKWIAHLTQNTHPQPLSHPLGEGGVGLSPRPTGGERESLLRHEDSQLETVRELSTFNFQPSTRRLWLPISVLLASVLIISFWQFRHTESPLLRRVFSVGNPNDFSWRNRVTAWQGAGRMILAKPIIGFGWGKAEEIYSKEYRAARLEESAAIQLNDYLMLGISAGVPALGCLLVYLGLVLLRNAECGVRNTERAVAAGLQTSDLRLQTSATVPPPGTRHPSPPTIAFAGAIVLLIGFWFDGGLFKLPTCVVFWALLELCRRQGDDAESLTARFAGRASVRASRLVSSLAPPMQGGAHGVTRHILALRWLAGVFAVTALGFTALHLGTPQLAVSERSLTIARKFLVPPQERTDFEFLAAKPIWFGQALKVLLQHAHLANYNRSLVNWKLDDHLYREFVLSPEIDSALTGDQAPAHVASNSLSSAKGGEGGGEEAQLSQSEIPSPRPSPRLGGEREMRAGTSESDPLNSEPSTIHSQPSTRHAWRRLLWEYFYPRIRKESSLEAAAEIVVRHLNDICKSSGGRNAKLEIQNSKWGGNLSIPEIWQRGNANQREFQIISVAALRSVGIPARLTVSGAAEFWNGAEWKVTPRLGPESEAGK